MWALLVAGGAGLVLIAARITAFVKNARGGMDWPTFLMCAAMKVIMPRTFPGGRWDVGTCRRLMTALCKKCPSYEFRGRIEDVVLTAEDGSSLSARVYIPALEAKIPPGPRGCLLWVHGGGWVVGDVVNDDGLVRKLAAESGMVALSVNYRMAPEHPYPAAIHDCILALRWWKKAAPRYGGDGDSIFLAGESAGGGLCAAMVAMNVDDAFTPAVDRASIKGLALLCPALADGSHYPSYSKYGDFGVLTSAQMEHFRVLYSAGRPHVRTEYAFSPILAPDTILAQFPPTLVVMAQFDPLVDEGLDMVAKLHRLGVEVEAKVYTSSSHAFTGADVLPNGSESASFVAAFLTKTFASNKS